MSFLCFHKVKQDLTCPCFKRWWTLWRLKHLRTFFCLSTKTFKLKLSMPFRENQQFKNQFTNNGTIVVSLKRHLKSIHRLTLANNWQRKEMTVKQVKEKEKEKESTRKRERVDYLVVWLRPLCLTPIQNFILLRCAWEKVPNKIIEGKLEQPTDLPHPLSLLFSSSSFKRQKNHENSPWRVKICTHNKFNYFV